MHTIDERLVSLRARLTEIETARRSRTTTEAPDFTVFEFIRPDENRLADIFRELLDPAGSHGQGNLFLKAFLDASGITLTTDDKAVHIRREDPTGFLSDNRRIDITIEVGEVGIGIKNKPWAGDQENQLDDYEQHLRSKYRGRFHLVYLSGSGDSPTSLSDDCRERLEQESRFHHLDYASGLRQWLLASRSLCRSQRVQFFLDDLIRYIEEQFSGGQPMGHNDMTDAYVQHALSSADDLALALGFAEAEQPIRAALIADFAEKIVRTVATELQRRGDGWIVRSGAGRGKPPEWLEVVTVTRTSWPGLPGSATALRATLAYDGLNSQGAYFQLRREHCDSSHEVGGDEDANRLVLAATDACGRGKRDSYFWPRWYVYADRFGDWSRTDVLVALKWRDEAVEYFAGKLLRLALAVDDAVRIGGE